MRTKAEKGRGGKKTGTYIYQKLDNLSKANVVQENQINKANSKQRNHTYNLMTERYTDELQRS